MVIRGRWFALSLLLPSVLSAHGEDAPRLVAGTPLVLEIWDGAPALDGKGPSVTVETTATVRGRISVYAVSDSLDPFLRVTDATDALLAEDDNGGGGKTPCVELDAELGARWIVTVASATPDGRGSVTLELRESPETEETLAAAVAAETALARARAAKESGDLPAARTLLEEAIGRVEQVAGHERSAKLCGVLWSLGSDASDLGALSAAKRAQMVVLRFRESFLPSDHPALQAARANLALTIKNLGDLAGAKALEVQVLEALERTRSPDDPDLQGARGNLAATIKNLGDLAGAKALEEQVLEVYTRTLPPDHPDLQWLRANLAETIGALGDLAGARALEEQVLDVYTRTLPPDHPDLQRARAALASTIQSLGDLAGAKTLQEQVLEVYTRTRPADDLDLQATRANFALTIKRLGDLAGARELEEQVLEVFERTLPPDHPKLQAMRGNLAWTMKDLGDLAGAKALQEQVLEAYARTLPPDHPSMQIARGNLAATMLTLGDIAGAKALQVQVLEVYTRTLPPDHPSLQLARGNLAMTISSLGDLAGAKTLFEQVLEVRTRTLPPDHPDLQWARGNLAATIFALGDLAGAKALQEQTLEVCARTLPPDHAYVQAARQGLAWTIYSLGDLAGAKALFEQILEARMRTLPPDHPYLQAARRSLAATIVSLGDPAGAKPLQEQVLEVYTRTLPPDHLDLQAARGDLALTIGLLGDHAGARALQEQALAAYERTLPPDDVTVQIARGNLSLTMKTLGDIAGAKALQEQVLAVYERTLPPDHPYLQGARQYLAVTASHLGERAEAAELTRALARGVRGTLAILGPADAAREVEALASGQHRMIDSVLSLSLPWEMADLTAEGFAAVESLRGAGAQRARLSRDLRGDAVGERMRGEIAEASAEVARRAGTGAGDVAEAVRARDAAERRLLAHLAERGRASLVPAVEASAIAAALSEGEAAVGYWIYQKYDVDPGTNAERSLGSSLLAYVLRPGTPLCRIELGPLGAVEAALEEWRSAIGMPLVRGVTLAEASAPAETETPAARERRTGTALRERVFDPLRVALGDSTRIVVAPIDGLHLVPFDALPDGEGVLGERYRITVRATLKDLTIEDRGTPAAPTLLALGGIDYDRSPEPVTPEGEPAEAVEPALGGAIPASAPAGDGASLGAPEAAVRGGGRSWTFDVLPESRTEVRRIAAYWDDTFGEDRPSVVLDGRRASREAFERLAPRARWLHLATHGYFAPESVASISDRRPAEGGMESSGGASEQVLGLAPMVLAGLAFAGANGAADPYGRVAGVMTAEELAALDLAGCELAVLSACETNVGVTRGGQGIASLQQALMAAGVRTAVTSLWKVPDEATREMMVEFYRRVWVLGEPKANALWAAKQKLREKRDIDGKPVHATRDWAGWVLSGEPE